MTDRILVNSESAKQSVVKKERVDPKDIDVIPNGIDVTKFTYSEEERHVNRQAFGLKADECCVGIIANMSRPVKRVDIFLKAAAEVYKHEKNTIFLVVGDGYLKDELEKLTKILGIESRTQFLGLQKEVIPYLASFDIGVCTSDSEGFSNAILEYMAMGLPVVATNVGGNKEVVQNEINGFLVNPNDPEAVAESILKIIKNGELKEKMSQNSLRMVRHYSWENKIKEIERYYQMILGRECCAKN
jgi:glycosyltransferase involved in cell wall biosynthesis